MSCGCKNKANQQAQQAQTQQTQQTQVQQQGGNVSETKGNVQENVKKSATNIIEDNIFCIIEIRVFHWDTFFAL